MIAMVLRTAFLAAVALVMGCTAAAVPEPAEAFETAAREALIVDHDTGMVLLEKNADVPMPPASMSKLMTIYLVFEALQQGRLQMDSMLPVSERAWNMQGSKMFTEVGTSIAVEDLIHGVIVQSGNDACIVLAEALSGSEEAFADRMNNKGAELGLTNSVFANSTGWPDPRQRMSARDLVVLAERLIRDFPEYYPYFSHTEFTWEGIKQENRNPLLYMGIGADGLKTGHTEEAGYGLVGSAVQGDRRVTFVITGLSSMQQRSEEAERLVTWAFRSFEKHALYKSGDVVAQAEVWLGLEDRVNLQTRGDLAILIPQGSGTGIRARVSYQGPVEAPIEAGQEIARLIVDIPDLGERSFPLVAAREIPRGGFLTRLNTSAGVLGEKVLELAGQGGD
jgi:D-alanyl-D-alanine carboxypeptidase (penicillin-binding protein 5/6)